jgi:RNase adaptor protein for sRNA GlmZ degradation
MAALEDLGFYCADNLPAPLLEQFLDSCAQGDAADRENRARRSTRARRRS